MMTLTPGTRLGPYEITAPIGAGGMGEVYKARDTRLDRTVAIKILPPGLAADSELRARFDREARAISGLDHPNICVLHDVGHEGEVDYLVMQYLDGEPLSSRLARGPLPLDEALRYASEIAAGLDRAHRAGILHRDLKPGNVMLTRSGARETSAKLVDFGLAKLAVANPSASPNVQATVTSALTDKGTILGTLLYMSPEQLQGAELDARSDIFSFGAMIYEMVTGARAFDGGSQASIIGAILEREPAPMATRTPLTPPALERVVRKCLAKDPERRWQSAADLRDEIAWIAQSSGAQQPLPGIGPRAFRLPPPAGVAAAVLILVLAAALAWALSRTGDEEAPPAWHLSMTLAPDAALTPGGVAVSPDGKVVVYAASPSTGGEVNRPSVAVSGGRLYMRRFNSLDSTPIPGTEGGRTPFFSPDGLSIGFFTETALMRVSLLGGPPATIVGVPPVTRGGTWLSNDHIVLAPTQSFGLHRVRPGAETDEPLTTPDIAQGEKGHMWPSALPGGTHVLYTIRRGTSDDENGDIAVVDVSTGERALILKDGTHAQYSSTGHLLFMRGGNLMAVPFDLSSRKTHGTPLPVAEKVSRHPWIGGAHYAVGPGGTLIFMRGSFGDVRTAAVWVDRSGESVASPTFSENQLGKPRVSPDGKRAVFDGISADGDTEIYVADLARGTTVRFSADPRDDFNPVWTADGSRVIWTALSAGRLPYLVWRSADGTGLAEEIVSRPEAQFAGSVSPSGILAYSQTTGAKMSDIWVVPLNGERTAQRFIQGAAQEYGPEFSPDGRWLAYVSDEAGAPDVYVVPYPGPGGKLRVTSGGGVAPVWRDDGKELFYQTSAGLMSIPVAAGPDPQFGAARLLFGGNFVRYSREDGPREYDVARGGNRFLMIKAERKDDGPRPTLNVVFNWPAEMMARTARR